MKTITLSAQELRILTLQIQAKGDGYSIGQLRQLDKVLDVLEEPIESYNASVEILAKENPEDLNQKLENLTVLPENQNKIVEIEDSDFDFVKELWSQTQGFLGNSEARKVILAIDDALNGAKDGPTNQV